jgi:O-antigen biosynthesis protein
MATKIINLELTEPLPELPAPAGFQSFRFHLFVKGKAVGKLSLRPPLSRQTLIEEISHYCLPDILRGSGLDQVSPLSFAPGQVSSPMPPTDFKTTLSIVIPTRDRPADLERCLNSLTRLKCAHPFEIVVADNNPSSGLTKPVTAKFPVKYIAEPRAGASYARNAGISQTSGEIIVFTDDDVVVTGNWLDCLVAPFADHAVMCVSGLVLPLVLDTEAQELFENYGEGGLERGFEYRKLGSDFFNLWHGAVQTWQLGGTANCAIRAEVFMRPEMGPFDETLGPGTAAGVGEDTYMFYRILKAGYFCVYQPEALVYHRHRSDMKALRRQLYSYSRGAVAQQLRIFFSDGDKRALVQIFRILPAWQLKRLFRKLFGWDTFPLHLILLEIWGNLTGFGGFVQSLRKIKKQGRITAHAIQKSRSLVAPKFITGSHADQSH